MSVSTVSRVINGRADVSAATRARVVEAIGRLSFAPQVTAQRLAGRRSHTIAMLFPSSYAQRSNHDLDFVLGAAEATSGRDYFFNVATDPLDEPRMRQMFRSGLVEGAILMQITVKDWRVELATREQLPCVLIGRTDTDHPLSWVDFDFEGAVGTMIDHLVATDDSEMQVMSMLRVSDAQSVIIDEAALTSTDPDLLAGPFAHVVVDEAQELTDAEWQMLLLRCPSRSFTIVGDRAQARHGFTGTWQERLERLGLDRVELASLSINYRTPTEVMAEAEPVIRAVLPDANVPTSVRSTGVPVLHGSRSDLRSILDAWLDEHSEGIACVIGAGELADGVLPADPRVRSLTPELSKGLEFDRVVLLDPETFGDGIEGTVDRYVAMTRATQRLVVLTG